MSNCCRVPGRLALFTLLIACVGTPTCSAPPGPPPPVTIAGLPTGIGQGGPPVTRLAIALGDAIPLGPNIGADTGTFRASVDVPAGPWTGGEALRLSGVYGRATVAVDGVVVATVEPGPGPNEIDLAGRLAPGVHEVQVDLTRADPPPPMVLGGDRRGTPLLVDGPTLLLRPAAYVDGLAVPLTQDNNVEPRARVHGAPDGAHVRFVATLDGVTIADLGDAPVVNGEARAAPVAWTLPQWKVGDPALFLVHALLQGADGALLDAYGARVGLRRVGLEPGGFSIGGASTRLVGWRSSPKTFAPEDFGPLVRTGANAVEFHGSPPTEQQLAIFDEIGVGVVLTPRCEGTFSTIPVTDRAGLVTANLPVIQDQTVRQTWSAAAHPSVVVWVSETRSLLALGNVIAELDPERRPVVGKDLPLENAMIGGNAQDPRWDGAWVCETAWEGPVGPIEGAVAAFDKALAGGIRGGVLEHREEDEAEKTWAPVLAKRGVRPVELAGRRTQGDVLVTGAKPGTVVWLEGPWLPATGAVAVTSTVDLQAWHAGPATVVAAGTRVPVQVPQRTWSLTGPVGESAATNLP